MTNARLRYNGLATGSAGSLAALTLSGAHNNSTTTLTFNAALTYANGIAVPTLAGGDYFVLSILDSNGNVAEIVRVTAYTTAGTTATVTRGVEGTTGVSHASGAPVVNAPTALDVSGRVLLDKQVLGSAAATITFSSSVVPTSGYEDLLIVLTGRGDTAANEISVNLSLNGDTTATNYRAENVIWQTSTTTASAADGRVIANLPAASAQANAPGSYEILLTDFLNTTFHKIVTSHGHNARQTAGSNEYLGLNGLHWENTAAVTSVALAASAGNFVTGTIARLYGLV